MIQRVILPKICRSTRGIPLTPSARDSFRLGSLEQANAPIAEGSPLRAPTLISLTELVAVR
jgi:hypothetical protein